MAGQDSRIDIIRQLVAGGGFQTDVFNFESRCATLVWAKKFLPGSPIYSCFTDVLIALAAIRIKVQYAADLERTEVYHSQVYYHPAETQVVASFMTTDPELYAGPKDGLYPKHQDYYGAFTEYRMWDAGYSGSNGLYNQMTVDLPSTQSSLQSLIDTHLYGYPEAITFVLGVTTSVGYVH